MAEPLQLSLPESFWAAEGRRLAVLIVPRLTALALEGARRGSDKIGIGFNYGIYNLLAEQWAREYTDALLKQVRTTNEAVVGDILARWISTPGSTFGDLHAALQPYFGIKRASVIAVTEATRAMASGELLAYQRAGIEKIQWGTNKDELVCPYCGGVNREVRTIGEPFGYFKWRKGQQPEPVYAPPYHPNCRCGISPVLTSVSVRKTVLILTDAAIVARTLRTLPPILAKGDFDGHPFRGNQWTGGQSPIPYLGDANDDRRIPTVADSPIQHIVQEQLKTLPENHMVGISDITFAEGDFVGGDAYGDYHPLTKRIRLASNADNIAVLGGGTAIHEVGHHVHLSRMTVEGADEWQRISGNGQNARISAYARTNRGEHFAEAYRAYMRGGDYRKKLKALEPASYKYMASVSRGKWLLPEGESASTDNWRGRYED